MPNLPDLLPGAVQISRYNRCAGAAYRSNGRRYWRVDWFSMSGSSVLLMCPVKSYNRYLLFFERRESIVLIQRIFHGAKERAFA